MTLGMRIGGRMLPMFVSAAVLCGIAAAARASDGRVEINQASVTAAGGFPFTISTPGSYVLTSNLTVATAADAINVNVAGVSIDLNGFEIAGPVSCTAAIDGTTQLLTATTCAGASSGTGVDGASEIHGGTIRGFSTGIRGVGGRSFRIHHMTIRENAIDAIAEGGANVEISDSVVSTNGDDGVAGQDTAATLLVSNCIFERNNDTGLYLSVGVAHHSTFIQNGGDGIRSNVGGGSMVVDNFFYRNSVGLNGNSKTGYRGNSFDGNTTNADGLNLGGNICGGALCP